MAVMALLADGGLGVELNDGKKRRLLVHSIVPWVYCRYWYTFTEVCIMHKNGRY
jgi:hypothetical protein